MQSVLVILGPTATGKSSLAMDLAERFGGEIVNADALQAYRRLEIGTAKPSPEDRSRIRHHLVDILEPHELFSAGEFARRAKRALADIERRRSLPMVVGGSGFYLQALFEGLSPIPSIPAETRAELRKTASEHGLVGLREELKRVDPEVWKSLSPGDTQRTLRALEVWRATGRSLSSWHREDPPRLDFKPLSVGLTLTRGLLYDRIADRVHTMLEEGWVEEVAGLLASGFNGLEPAFQAIGYSQLVKHLQDKTPLADVVNEIIGATRRYAKRQLTWFRRDKGIRWFLATNPETLTRAVTREVETFLENRKKR